MTNELQLQKLDRAFDQLDVNANGQIQRDDLIGLGSRLLLGFGMPPTSGKGRDVLDRCDALWGELAAEADVNHDDAISPAEFRAAMIRAYIEGGRFDRAFGPATSAVAALTDHDNDGFIGPKEFRTMQLAFGTSESDSQDAFVVLDAAGAGRITIQELVDAARDYYLSPDPSARGNQLFGSL